MSKPSGGNSRSALLAELSQFETGDVRRAFRDTDAWVFDLDNTLYPSQINLFAQVDQRMGEFIAKELGVPFAYARHLQKSYYHQYGTTLTGLMKIHRVDPTSFLEYVHDIDLGCVSEQPGLREAIAALPGRKLIFTNGARVHAERVAGRLGVLDLFEDICSIESSSYVPKPSPEAFLNMVRNHDIAPARAAMFEDLPHNLEPAHELGMVTVLVHSTYFDHPIQKEMASWQALPDHVDFLTDDLTQFLADGWGGDARHGADTDCEE